MKKTLDMEQLENITGGVIVPPPLATPVTLGNIFDQNQLAKLPVNKEIIEETGSRIIDEGVKLKDAVFTPSILKF